MADKNISGGVQYRVAPREGGKYFAVERRSNGSSTWVSEGSSAPTKEEAEQIVLNLSQGKTAKGDMNVSDVPQASTFKMDASNTESTVKDASPSPKAVVEEKKNPLGGLSTEEWVAQQKAAGLSDDDIMKAYEAEGYSRDGSKFKAALAKYEEKQSDVPAPKKEEPSTSQVSKEPEDRKPYSADSEKAAKMGKYLAQNIISAYKDGQFGERGTAGARLNFGLYLLNEIGARMANAASVARGGSGNLQSDWSRMKANNEETNKAIRAYEAQYKAAQEELISSMGKENWDDLSSEDRDSKTLELLQRKGVVAPQTREGLATTDQTGTVKSTEIKKGVVELKNLTQSQKQTATQNLSALLARRSELQQAIAALQSDQGWDAYKQAMEAYVGTARGLESVGLADNVSNSINKGNSIGVSANIGAGSITGKFVNGSLSGNAAWTNSSTASSGKSTTSSSDALAKAKFKDGESYAKASAEARKEANAQLIANLQSEIEVINQAIDAWSKDLGVSND